MHGSTLQKSTEAVLTLRDMTSDAQTPLAHATMLRDTSGFQWHIPKTCDMSMNVIGTFQKPVTCQWTVSCRAAVKYTTCILRSSIRFIASRNSFVQQIFLC